MAETPRNDTPRVALSNLQPAPGTTHTRKRVGRGQGSGNGKTAGRGHKGAQSRSGYKQKRGFEGGQMPLHRRVPKRGFHNPFRMEYAVVNLDTLGERFAAGTVVTPDVLREQGIVRGPRARVKVLGRGDLSVALTVHAHKFSGHAAEKIRAAGGAAETIAEFAATEADAAGSTDEAGS
jgi:large subunit ribosomal protein L15